MMMLPQGVKVHVALGITDMRKGLDGLAMLVQGTLQQDPFSGHLFAFRARRADLIKIVFWDGTGLCLFTKRLEQSRFPWPVTAEAGGTVALLGGAVDAYRRDRLAFTGAQMAAGGSGLSLHPMRPIDSVITISMRLTGSRRNLAIHK